MQSFNQLTPAQTERLDMLQEECAEVIKAVAKIKRHGLYSYNPDAPDKGTNRQQLDEEILDVLAVIEMLKSWGDISHPYDFAINDALTRKLRYTHHQEGS